MADVRIKPWHISLDGPVSEYSESLFAVGNGCLGMRGFSLQTPKRRPYDHAVFRAGFFEPIRPGVTDMVQLPDALGLRVVFAYALHKTSLFGYTAIWWSQAMSWTITLVVCYVHFFRGKWKDKSLIS